MHALTAARDGARALRVRDTRVASGATESAADRLLRLMAEAHSFGTDLSPGEARKVSYAQMLVYELRVRDAMTSGPITAAPTDTLRAIQLMMKTHRFSGVPIVADGALVGVISIEDIINALEKGHINDPAGQWMSRKVATLRDHFSLVHAVGEFDRQGFGRLPVLDAENRLVGILTRTDITNCLVRHLERRAEEAIAHEAALVAARAADAKARRVVVSGQVKSGDFETAGKVSKRIRDVLRERGADPDARRRAAIIAYEAETNIIIHSIGGRIRAVIDPDKVAIEAVDKGPGIEQVELALREGWSTAGPLARELGFGAGMGLPNIKKCADTFAIQSELGSGTRLHAEVFLRPLSSSTSSSSVSSTAPAPAHKDKDENQDEADKT